MANGDLSRVADQDVEAQCADNRDQDQIEYRNIILAERQWQDDNEKAGDRCNCPFGNRQRVERHVGGIAGLEDSGFTMEHGAAISHALDTAAAEDAFGPQHQGYDHQHVGSEILCAAADIGVEVAGGEVFDDAYDQPADHRAEDRVEAAEDDDRKHFETDESKLVVDAEHRAPDDPAKGRYDARHRPSEREIATNIDPHRHRDLLAIGDGSHRNADAALQEKPAEGSEEGDADHSAHQLHRRQHDRAQFYRLVADRHHDRPGAGPESEGRASPEDRGQPDCRHHDRDHRPADQWSKHNPLQPKAEQHHAANRQ